MVNFAGGNSLSSIKLSRIFVSQSPIFGNGNCTIRIGGTSNMLSCSLAQFSLFKVLNVVVGVLIIVRVFIACGFLYTKVGLMLVRV